jgi:MFS family permease
LIYNARMSVYSGYSRVLGLVGNVLEHQDRALLSFAAPFIAGYFFSDADPVTAVIDVYGVIVLSLLMRPLGALFFGWFGDNIGRKAGLLLSLFGMSLSTFLIVILPSYADIGYWSPIGLFVIRSMQNFFGSGEVVSAGVYVMEHTPTKKHSLVSSIFEASTMLGVVLASALTTIWAYFGLLESSWQTLFLFSSVLGFILLLFRFLCKESPEFIPQEEKKFRLKELWNERVILLSVALVTGFSYATYLLSIRLMNAYLKVTTSLSTWELTSINTYLSVADMLLLPLFGLMAYRLSSSYLMIYSSLLTGVLALPLFWMLTQTKSVLAIITVRVTIMVLGIIFTAPYRVWLQNLVIARKRCTVLSFGAALGHLASEGPLTMLSLVFVQFGNEWMPGLLLSILGFCSAYVIWMTTRPSVKSTPQQAIQVLP